jgi:hypothetical protein
MSIPTTTPEQTWLSRARALAGGALLAAALVAAGPRPAQAEQPGAATRAGLLALPEVAAWLAALMSAEERAALRAEDLTVSGMHCGCYDRPTPHYPYAVVIFSSPKGDLVARFEGDEGSMRISPLALRTGTRYCSIYPSEGCFGEFATPCEFTDARFGKALAPYFPDCKG